MKPTLFTPNTERGGALRYRLYRHGPTTFSSTPEGEVFEAEAEVDACGLPCRCGAFITPRSPRGKELLAEAEIV